MNEELGQGLSSGEPKLGVEQVSINFDRLKNFLNRLNIDFKCEICLQEQFVLNLGPNDGSSACLPFYDLQTPSNALSVRYFVQLMCNTCGNTKLLDRKFIEARLTHEG